jgi:predicted metal-dependent HD superfamily phosphohydrolase
MEQRLRDCFIQLCARCNTSVDAAKLWDDIREKYSNPKRHYHNLTHLSAMLDQLELCQDQVHDWDSVLFALFYHDYVYKISNKDNEERSADEASKKLFLLQLSPSRISIVKDLIIATKSHQHSTNNDVNLFTDADLSILGSNRETYEQYVKQVRKEYNIYPDLLYRPGRKKVLNHFLDMPSIFKTEFFRERLEQTARENIAWEIGTLS